MFLHKSPGTASWRLMIIVTCCCCCYLLLGNSLLSLSHRRPRRLRMRPSRQQTQGTGSDDHRSQRSVARVWSHWEPQCQCFLMITTSWGNILLIKLFQVQGKMFPCLKILSFLDLFMYWVLWGISLASLVFDNVEQPSLSLKYVCQQRRQSRYNMFSIQIRRYFLGHDVMTSSNPRVNIRLNISVWSCWQCNADLQSSIVILSIRAHFYFLWNGPENVSFCSSATFNW